MKNTFYSILGVIFLSSPLQIFAQCSMVPVSLDQRIDQAELIVEAKIVEQNSFVNNLDGHIYTANKLFIYKVLKGTVPSEEIELISQGGIVGDIGEKVTPSLYVAKNVEGLFFLNSSEVKPEKNSFYFAPSSGPQSCIYYDVVENTASDAFNTYASIEDVYKIMDAKVGSSYLVVNNRPAMNIHTDKSAFPKIDSLSPLLSAAGTGNILTIYGINFGATRKSGKVEFTNASTGSAWAEPLANDYISWSDTKIEVKIISAAGTGAVRVTQDGTNAKSGLVLKYSWLNMEIDNTGVPVLHRNNNGTGGFTWKMSSGFKNNTDAKNSIIRALASWSDETCINWENGTATTVDADVADGVNNIRFGKPGELSTGVLAHTRSYYTNCSKTVGYVNEIDLTFSIDRNWNYSESFPSFNEYDIESVAVHELGHAHQLGHVKNSADFMHATISTGKTKRNLIDNNIESGLHIMLKSVLPASCGPNEMKSKSGCTLPIGISEPDSHDGLNVYPNPFDGKLTIQTSKNAASTIEIYNGFGQLVDNIGNTQANNLIVWDAPSSFNNGIYYLRIMSEGNSVTKKIILNR